MGPPSERSKLLAAGGTSVQHGVVTVAADTSVQHGVVTVTAASKKDDDGAAAAAVSDADALPKGWVFPVVQGVIQAVLLVPVTISFSAIIFKHPVFAPYLPQLSRLVIASSMVHQTCFAAWSTLPFAVGQVQDAGLIFLSAIASGIATRAQADHDQSPCAFACDADDALAPAVVATTLITLGACTCALGAMLVVAGRLRLASLVQYLPMPVIGGYLAYIGFFCGQAGLGLMAGVELDGIGDWPELLAPSADPLMPAPLLRVAPGLVLGVGLYALVTNVRHDFALPGAMIAIVAAFYFVLYFVVGADLAAARAAGWVAMPTDATPAAASPPPADDALSALDDSALDGGGDADGGGGGGTVGWWSSWMLYDATRMAWRYVPAAAPPWLAMVVVVAFSSSLDVAAIEMELGVPLDYDAELRTVGASNFVSGLFGGFSGSYIFSQTIFALRAGVRSRLCGATIAILECGLVVAPFSVVAYVPKCFFGALLVMIATDLMLEWLWRARHKMAAIEYAVALATFGQ